MICLQDALGYRFVYLIWPWLRQSWADRSLAAFCRLLLPTSLADFLFRHFGRREFTGTAACEGEEVR